MRPAHEVEPASRENFLRTSYGRRTLMTCCLRRTRIQPCTVLPLMLSVKMTLRAVMLTGFLAMSCAGPATSSPTARPTVAAPSASAAAGRPTPEVANAALAARTRESGRSEVAICLYVDPNVGLDPNAALATLQGSLDALVRQGYSVLGARPASLCPQPPHYIRTNSVHPKNSGNGPVAGVSAVTVTTPSTFQLVFAVTTAARIDTIFGGMSSHRGTEEVTCSGDNCGGVTESIYTDAAAFATASERERLLFEGFGLLGS